MSTVLLFGATCLDYISLVKSFPSPDEKLRTDSLTITVGGNAANTSTCLSRLGVRAKLISKIGSDINGEKIREQLNREKNLDTNSMLVESTMEISPMTYVIVDKKDQTRTCLFSAKNEEIRPENVRSDWLEQIDFVHFDSRSTEAAVELARLAKAKSLPCSLDLERQRNFIDQLIPQINYIITTENYSKNVCHDATICQTAVRFLQTYRETCRFVIVTLGARGSVLIEPLRDRTRLSSFTEGSQVTCEIVRINEENFLQWNCTAWQIDQDKIQDTTGSGDAFIGGVIYALVSFPQWPKDRLLRFASYVAMCKLKGLGAQSTLPFLSEIDMKLFH